MNLKRRLINLLLVMVVSSIAFSMQLFVPVDDEIYDYLERQATRGYIPELMNDSKPLQRDDIAQWLFKLNEIKHVFNKVDRELLNEYISEYRHELTDKKHPALTDSSDYRLGFSSWDNFKGDMKCLVTDNIYNEENHIYLMEDGKNTIWINADLTFRGEGKNKTLRYYDKLGAEASFQIGDHLSMFVDGYFFHQVVPDAWQDLPDEASGSWINDHEFNRILTFDKSEAYFNVTGKYGTFSIAQYPIEWGNSLNSTLLSKDAVTFGSIRYTKKFKNFKYSFIHGNLMTTNYSWSEEIGKTYDPKYLVGHNIEINFSPKFHVTFSEMLIYGNRLPEPTYMIPVILLWPSEHTLGDRDNKMISIGIEAFPMNGIRAYGSIFMDELSFTKLNTDWWANKYALQGGVQFSPRKLPMDIQMELTAVHPWTYTHRFEYASYAHHGEGLGFYLGPNTRLFTTAINYDLTAKDKISLEYNYTWEGADSIYFGGIGYPVGGDVNQNYEDRFNILDFNTTWLMGDISTISSLKLDWLHRWRNQIEFLSSCELRSINNTLDIYYSFQIHLRY